MYYLKIIKYSFLSFWERERNAGRADDYESVKRIVQKHYAQIFNDADIVYQSVNARQWGICLTLWLSNLKFLPVNIFNIYFSF